MSKDNYTIFDYTRSWWEFAFDHGDVKPLHHAIYFYSLQLNNMLGWKKEFGFPTSQAMEATGIRSYNTYIRAFRDLVDWGVIDLIEKSENQWKANVIALSKIDKSLYKSLDKSVLNHMSNQERNTVQNSDSINKPKTNRTKNLKKEKGNETRALDFLNKNYPSRFETQFLMRYQNKIKDIDSFIKRFNNKVDTENLEYTDKILFARLDNFADSWIKNQTDQESSSISTAPKRF